MNDHARGGGTSQSGQTVNATRIVDCSNISTACSSALDAPISGKPWITAA
jgi:hypothetical protein